MHSNRSITKSLLAGVLTASVVGALGLSLAAPASATTLPVPGLADDNITAIAPPGAVNLDDLTPTGGFDPGIGSVDIDTTMIDSSALGVSNVTVTYPDSRTATLNWTVNPQTLSLRLAYRAVSADPSAPWTPVLITGTPASVKLTGLRAGVKYEYVVTGYHEGFTGPGLTGYVTPPQVTAAAIMPVNVVAVSTGAGSLTVGWSRPDYTPDYYNITLTPVTYYSAPTSITTTVSGFKNGYPATLATINNLPDGVLYRVTIVASNEGGLVSAQTPAVYARSGLNGIAVKSTVTTTIFNTFPTAYLVVSPRTITAADVKAGASDIFVSATNTGGTTRTVNFANKYVGNAPAQQYTTYLWDKTKGMLLRLGTTVVAANGTAY